MTQQRRTKAAPAPIGGRSTSTALPAERLLYTVAGAAAVLSLPDDRVRRLITEGVLPTVAASDASIRLTRGALDAYIRVFAYLSNKVQ